MTSGFNIQSCSDICPSLAVLSESEIDRRSLTSAGANAEAAGKHKPGDRSALAVAGQGATQYANEIKDKINTHDGEVCVLV